MEIGHLVIRKIFKFVATRFEILRLKCNKLNLGLQRSPDPLTALKDLLLREGRKTGGNRRVVRGEGKRSGEKRKWEGRGRRGKKGGKETPKGWFTSPMFEILYNTLLSTLPVSALETLRIVPYYDIFREIEAKMRKSTWSPRRWTPRYCHCEHNAAICRRCLTRLYTVSNKTFGVAAVSCKHQFHTTPL